MATPVTPAPVTPTKPWYASKVVWMGVITTLLGVLPLVNVYANVVAPQTVTIVAGTGALISGILTVILRVWFTDTAVG